eukprot:7525573-Pyramimonas_sp.AAC.1
MHLEPNWLRTTGEGGEGAGGRGGGGGFRMLLKLVGLFEYFRPMPALPRASWIFPARGRREKGRR